ncbi:MAG: hypothetical protein HY331_14055 [Chloroflexi bacterium]|nr:hypothetical protein [Chloroflexota bacterium]
MGVLNRAANRLRDLELLLRQPPPEGVDPVAVADRIHEVREILCGEDAQCVGTTEAKRLLGEE